MREFGCAQMIDEGGGEWERERANIFLVDTYGKAKSGSMKNIRVGDDVSIGCCGEWVCGGGGDWMVNRDNEWRGGRYG